MSPARDRYVQLCQQALVLAVVAAAVVPSAGVVTLEIVSPTGDPGAAGARAGHVGAPVGSGSLVAAAPVTPTVREVPLTGQPDAARAAVRRPVARALQRSARRLAGGPAVVTAVSGPEQVGGFATLGITWDRGAAVSPGSLRLLVRTRSSGSWSGWQELPYDADHGPDPGSAEASRARPGTDAMAVGHVADVQVAAETADGTAPAGLRLALIDPGRTVSDREAPAIDTARLASASTTGVTPKPKIFSRAQWGANERMRDASSLRYGEVHGAFVHHTVNANRYSRKDVPAIIRGIYAFHTQSRGWSDVGYNYLVDRFGRIWEGRFGGVARPVVGAHTLGFNEWSTAMSAIGNFDIARPPQAVLTAYARLWAWKLSLHGVDVSSTRQRIGSRFFQAINGHRDAGQTACPGRYLYAKLPEIRRKAAAYQHPFTSRDLRPQLLAAAGPEFVVRDARTRRMAVVSTGGDVRFAEAQVVASGWKGKDLVAAAGDLTGDGRADFVAREAGNGVTDVYAGTPKGPLTGPVPGARTGAFAGADQLTGAGDFDGDGRNDLISRDARTHRLLLYRGNGRGGFAAPVMLAGDWRRYRVTTGVGDFDRDGHRDLMVRTGRGRVFLVPGRGTSLRDPVPLAHGWRGLLGGGGDVTGDGQPDVVVRGPKGRARVYAGDGAGGAGPAYGPYRGFGRLTWVATTGDVVGSGAGDLVGLDRKGRLLAFAGATGGGGTRVHPTSVSLAGVDLLLGVGDWNHDGFGDVMTRRRTTGDLQLRLGHGSARFDAPVVVARGWGGVRQVIAVGDVTGDGNNDLMARQGRGGPFRIYPGNGKLGIRPGYLAHSAVPGRQAALGLFDRDGAPDTVLARADGSLWLYPGNGPGGMTGGRRVATGLSRYDWILGLGDVDGDSRADLVGRRADGLWLVPGRRKGFGAPRLIGSGFRGYDLAG